MTSPLNRSTRHRWPQAAAALAAACALAGPPAWAATAAAAPPPAPLLSGLQGPVTPIESRSPLVRRYVTQGVLLVYGFNPAEAVRSLQAAVDLDPRCASCWWALAWALGPNINTDMALPDTVRAEQALAQARRHAHRADPVRR